MDLSMVKKRIEDGIPGAKVEIDDPRNDGVHIHATVISNYFKDKSMVEQHRMVYDTLKEELKEELHALGLTTKVN